MWFQALEFTVSHTIAKYIFAAVEGPEARAYVLVVPDFFLISYEFIRSSAATV